MLLALQHRTKLITEMFLSMNMHKWLGVTFLVAGIASFWQNYLVLRDRNALWENEKQYCQSQTEIPERTPAWDRDQQFQVSLSKIIVNSYQ